MSSSPSSLVFKRNVDCHVWQQLAELWLDMASKEETQLFKEDTLTNLLKNETKKYVLQLSGSTELMSNYPVDSLSIAMREKIVLPLLTIQQYAINKMREMEEQLINSSMKETYEKLVIRSSFGIINAGRNSA